MKLKLISNINEFKDIKEINKCSKKLVMSILINTVIVLIVLDDEGIKIATI